jgi:hypothetical protein
MDYIKPSTLNHKPSTLNQNLKPLKPFELLKLLN